MRLTSFAIVAILGVTSHDASQCLGSVEKILENGKFDNDCCAVMAVATCDNGFSLTQGDICYPGQEVKDGLHIRITVMIPKTTQKKFYGEGQ